MRNWKIFKGNVKPHNGLLTLPDAPPWRFPRGLQPLKRARGLDLQREQRRAAPFLPSAEMITAVNAALYLRRPLMITGKPGTGKSTLISKVAYELKLGPVIRWPITSRSTVQQGVYTYDAVGRLQAGRDETPPVEKYLKLGPLGTALTAVNWPRPLLIDEIDKSDLDFANDLLNVIEEGEWEIAELKRLGQGEVRVDDYFGDPVEIQDGRIRCGQFPFVVMTSNAEREFPAPFLRRCVRLTIEPPSPARLAEIVDSQLAQFSEQMNQDDVTKLITDFVRKRNENRDVSTDQLLNALFLTVAMRDAEQRSFGEDELKALRDNLFRELSGPAS